MRKVRLLAALLLCLGVASTAAVLAQGFKDMEKQVYEETLPNGLKLIVLPRPGAPVVSMVTYADVGGVDEMQNKTGLAHVFEHMAFKGTTTVGTKDLAKERIAMKKEDDAFAALRAERLRRPRPDEAKVKQLEEALKAAQDEARQYVAANEIGEIIERNGGQGLNAFTSWDQTVYHYSLPANKLELWAALESDRFTNAVIREFYKEVDVIKEEKRMGESNPTGRLIDDFMAVAYKAHMYRSFVIGQMSDLFAMRRSDAEEWFNKYYGGKNLTAVIVGDLDFQKALPMLRKYLGAIPPREKPGTVITTEPPQRAEKRLIMEDASQPVVVIGFHRPDINDPDFAAYTALSDIMGGGRSSRLYKSMVKEKQIALAAGCFNALGEKYPGLFLFFSMPNKGKTNDECEAALLAELDRVKNEPVTAEELDGVKARAKARFINSIDDNMGLAMGFARAQNLEGDWRQMFRQLEKIDRVTAADIQRVAQKTFVKANRTVGRIETLAEKK